jgi:hypothetical protein
MSDREIRAAVARQGMVAAGTAELGTRYRVPQLTARHHTQAVLNAVLPEVTTVEELLALPDGTPLIGHALTRRPYFWYLDLDMRERPDVYLRAFGPFTVWTAA